MRVAFDATPLLDRRTGIGAFVAELLARLPAEGVDVVAYGLTRKYLPELRRRLPDGVASTARPVPARTVRWLWDRWSEPSIERWTGPVDVVHGPNFEVPPARAVQLVTVHDLTCVHFPELCDANTRRYPRIIRRAIARGAHVHTVSRTIAHEVGEVFGVADERIHVIPNGVDDSSGGDPAAGRRAAGAERFVLAVGTEEPRKNLPVLIGAFDEVADAVPDITLVIAGGRGWGTPAVDAAVAHAPWPERIRRLGHVDDTTRRDLLSAATIVAYPSIYEGFGLPPLEAMSVGIPVLASDAGALPEVLGSAAELVAPTERAVGEGLRRLLEDDARRSELAVAGRAQAARYSWDATARGLAELYARLAS